MSLLKVQKQVAGCGVVQLLGLQTLLDVLRWVAEIINDLYYGFLNGDVLIVLLLLEELYHELAFLSVCLIVMLAGRCHDWTTLFDGC